METAYIVLGLLGTGYYLNKNGKTPRSNYYTQNNIDPDLLPYSDIEKYQHPNTQESFFSNVRPEMQPNVRKETQPQDFNNTNQLDQHIGRIPKNIGPKQEQEPLFAPTPNVYSHNEEFNNNEDYKQRFVSSQYMNNEVPVQAQQVGPGLNVGPDVVSTGGFHQHLRIMPQNVHNYNQLESRIIQGKAETESYTQRPDALPELNNPRFYIRSNESFLPTMASVQKMTTRPQVVQSESDIRGLKGNNELHIGGAVSYQQDSAYGRMGDYYMKETDRGCANPMIANAFQGNGQMVYNQPQLHVTNREETYQHPIGMPSQGYAYGENRSAQYDMHTQRGQQNNTISNVRGSEQSHMIPTGYRSDPTNRGNVAIPGAPSFQNKYGTTELDSAYSMTTGREAMHQEYVGGANGGVSFKPGMTYEDIINNEGYSLRSVTDENRTAGPQKINSINQDPKDRLKDVYLKEERNSSREGGVTPSNPLYGNLGKIDVTPNKLENPNERMDPALVQTQMEQNPLRLEGKNAVLKPATQDEPTGVPVY